MRDSTYSPWLGDPEFQRVYAAIQQNTMVEVPRLYELWMLARQVKHLGGALIEVGCWRGGAGCIMAAAAHRPIVLCDTFRGVVKTGENDNLYRGGEHSDATEQQVRDAAKSVGIQAQVLAGIFPDDTGHEVSNLRFAMAHVDVDVYRSTKEVAEFLWPRLLVGGVIVYDDYGNGHTDGIRDYIHEQAAEDRLWIHNLNGHAVVVKLHCGNG